MADREQNRKMRREGVENQVEGTIDEFKGKVRGDLGDATDNHSEHVKGRIEEGVGKAKRKIGEAQERLADNRD